MTNNVCFPNYFNFKLFHDGVRNKYLRRRYKHYLKLILENDQYNFYTDPSNGYSEKDPWIAEMIFEENDYKYAQYICERIFKKGGARDKFSFIRDSFTTP